ncbi:MAG: HD-GYP domain-containing protein [Eubacteriales bacterium]|nr:HD-GYP domain-containing protein [Bacillota bacterium]MBV1727831.1 HD-GYP domain-containing protein [Desulforudis sp.]MDQ7788425.1 HD-GYP domain-containing protein [Clostridia bacterium]MDZ4042115.1 HD-GYP domain-containing protein [Eubacteriales bacterium]MBU4532440.1 HD-GYP domain-containing protein [Bacillota bacterium]
MRSIPTRLLHPGMRLARRVYGRNGEVYLNAGVELTVRYISRLQELGFSHVHIEDRLMDGIEVKDVIAEETRTQAVRQVKGLLRTASSACARAIIHEPALTRTVDDIVEQLLSNTFSMLNLTEIRADGEYLFHHSVSVAVISLMAGMTLGYGRERLYSLGMGALLHDVGKVKVPKQILDKAGALTAEEFAEVKKHSTYGRDILRDNPDAAEIAYAHHERYNGDGYPRGQEGRDIHVFAQLTGLADVFDALTSDRCYRRAKPPCDALELLSGSGNWWFEARLVQAFMHSIAAYPTGTVVELSSGETGIVIDTPKGHSFFPNVRVLMDPEGAKVIPHDISTMESNLWVARALNDDEGYQLLGQLAPQ